jgi:hypothetical protein
VTEPVRLTIVANEPAAEAIRALLETEGIESFQRKTDFAAGMTDASSSFGRATGDLRKLGGP